MRGGSFLAMIARGSRSLAFGVALVTALALGACTTTPRRPVTLTFAGLVGGQPFACGATYDGIGTTGTTLTALDFRFYVHDLALVTADGRAVPIALDADPVWQTGGVALLDFEAGTGCEEGNAPTRTIVTGTIPDDGTVYTGLRFHVGIPAAMNHLDADTQPSPLNLTSLFWGWSGGYKFFRVDGRSTGQPGGFRFHLGSTGCTGDPRNGSAACANENVPEITLTGFDAAHDAIVADLAGLFEGSDLDHDQGVAPGCMSDVEDPDCAPLFDAIGLGTGAQTTFRVQAGGI